MESCFSSAPHSASDGGIFPSVLHYDTAPPAIQESLYAQITSRYETVSERIPVGDTAFQLLMVGDTNQLLDAIDPASFALDERLPYWAELWSSSLELARFCMQEGSVRGERVLDLGCGLGLAGIAAAAAGGIVTLTDYELDALLFARYNALVNLSSEVVRTGLFFRHLDWREPLGLDRYDTIIGADILYERKTFLPLVDLFRVALRPGGRVILTDPGRSIGNDFITFAAGVGFTVDTSGRRVLRRNVNSSVTLYAMRLSSDSGDGRE